MRSIPSTPTTPPFANKSDISSTPRYAHTPSNGARASARSTVVTLTAQTLLHSAGAPRPVTFFPARQNSPRLRLLLFTKQNTSDSPRAVDYLLSSEEIYQFRIFKAREKMRLS
jgi:hypothetical protein